MPRNGSNGDEFHLPPIFDDMNSAIRGSPMYKPGFESRTADYVLNCRCNRGGFCFYMLDEPNGSDTYYALSTLRLLGADRNDDDTVAYLKRMQKDDGTYDSIYSAYYSIKSLLLLNEKPLYNPECYILNHMRIYNVDHLPAGINSIFKPMFYLIEVTSSMNVELDITFRTGILDFILQFKHDDHGFGYNYSTLIDTAQALSILNWLNYPIDSLGTTRFLSGCESEVYGFCNIPNTAPSFIEHVYAGILASTLVAYEPRYFSRCIEFILRCQNRNGGFARSSVGIATLEYTYYAIYSLSLLSVLKKNHFKQLAKDDKNAS